ncbi:hypothetical protein EXD82_00615 [Peptacetobacter hominis]|uniref:Uncharacterized protein n=1 Tax=Peptacetobacter hominis TaxID=2743610 RepID=A0A544QYF1_9FIRM|nr:hypothetical protein [Peptacetobacter hominis]TQQ85749.1 hypothetical protein EXD82_00615 [Peptacetobacter hominis]
MYFFKESVISFIVGSIALYGINYFNLSFNLLIMIIAWFLLILEACFTANVIVRLYEIIMKKIMK